MGMTLVGELPDDGIEIWPENAATVEVFIAMGTQWNVGAMGGVIGLRYEALPAVLRLCGIPKTDRAGIFDGLRVMESAAIEAINHG
jgi:hypothetical protein